MLKVGTRSICSSLPSGTAASGLILCAAVVVFAGCTARMPKNVPESISVIGAEPQIPDEYMGCWRGTLTELDTVHTFSPFIPASYIRSSAVATTYELCFTRQPDGTRKLELTDVEIPGHEVRVTSFHNRITSLDTNLRRAWMRNHVTAESTAYILFFPLHQTQDIYAEEELQIISPHLIRVRGTQTVVIGNQRIAEMSFHTDFYHVPGRRCTARSPNTNRPDQTDRGTCPDYEERL